MTFNAECTATTSSYDLGTIASVNDTSSMTPRDLEKTFDDKDAISMTPIAYW